MALKIVTQIVNVKDNGNETVIAQASRTLTDNDVVSALATMTPQTVATPLPPTVP